MDTRQKLNWIIENRPMNSVAAEQALNYINAGIAEHNIYINTDEQFGTEVAITEDEIYNPSSWPEDWKYEGDTADFTELEDWLKNWDDKYEDD